MLVIRLQRTGRKNQPSYRIVVAEKARPVKGKHLEIVGSYNPSEGKRFEVKEDRVKYWISVGARPSDTVAGLLKFNGIDGMEKYMDPRTKARSKKNPTEEELAAAEAANNPEPAAEEAAAPAEEAPAAEETPAEEPAKEEEKAEEAAEAPAEEPAPEETPAEEPAAEEAAE